MYKKLISSILVVALLNLVGCYSFKSVTVPEYSQIEEEDKPNEIKVKTKDSQQYHFSDSNFYIENDTLYGKGILFLSEEELPFEGKIAFGEIESIQLEEFGQKYPTTISQYQKIEAERGKPDEIYLTKYDSTEYHFMKNDYYIENDTLYGEGEMISDDNEQPFEGKIALSEIESIEVDKFNLTNTIFLSVGIAGIVSLIYVAILFASGEISLSGN